MVFTTGKRIVVRFLASRVDHSGACKVSLLADVRPETVARAMRDHFEHLGGVPEVAAFDAAVPSLTTRAPSKVGYLWDPVFAGALEGIGVELALHGRRRSPTGDTLEAEVKASFFEGRRFADKGDLEHKLTSWCDLIALQRITQSGEHTRLRQLEAGPDNFAVPVEVRVSDFGVMHIAGHCYVVRAAAGQCATALLYPTVVRLCFGDTETLLPRKYEGAAVG